MGSVQEGGVGGVVGGGRDAWVAEGRRTRISSRDGRSNLRKE